MCGAIVFALDDEISLTKCQPCGHAACSKDYLAEMKMLARYVVAGEAVLAVDRCGRAEDGSALPRTSIRRQRPATGPRIRPTLLGESNTVMK